MSGAGWEEQRGDSMSTKQRLSLCARIHRPIPLGVWVRRQIESYILYIPKFKVIDKLTKDG